MTGENLPDVMPLPVSILLKDGNRIATETAAACYQYIYSSYSLTNWSLAASRYWAEPDEDWVLSLDASYHQGFFRAARVVYTPDENITGDISNHHLEITLSSLVLQVWPEPENNGVFKYASEPDDQLVAWSWDKEPHRAVLFIETDYPEYYTVFLHYSTPHHGRCRVYCYSGEWQDLGEGTFTVLDLN